MGVSNFYPKKRICSSDSVPGKFPCRRVVPKRELNYWLRPNAVGVWLQDLARIWPEHTK